jgi:protein TonB
MDKNNKYFNLSFIEMILLSLLLHASLLIIVPQIKINALKMPEILDIEITMDEPKIKLPDPPKPVEKKEVIKNEPKKVAPQKIVEELPSIKEKEVPPEALKEPIQEPQKIQEEQVVSPQKNTEAIQQMTDTYTNVLTRAIAAEKKYPKLAQMRQWQGEVLLKIEISPNGELVSANIQKESRYKILNEEAIAMVKRASPFPKPPEDLQKSIFTVIVPISFKLE